MKRRLFALVLFLTVVLSGCAQDLVEEGMEESGKESVEIQLTQAAEYSSRGVSMKLMLPESWDYRTVEAQGENGLCGIEFWVTDESQTRLELMYHPQGIGICGTGVEFTHTKLPGGKDIDMYTEHFADGTLWFMVTADGLPENCAFQGQLPSALWLKHQSVIWEIIDNAEAVTVMPGGETTQEVCGYPTAEDISL